MNATKNKLEGLQMKNQIQYYRKKQGLTQLQLAERAYCSVTSISGWENGLKIPRVDTALCLAHALNVQVEDLFGKDRYEGK